MKKKLLSVIAVIIIGILVLSMSEVLINANTIPPVISVVLSGTTGTNQLPSVSVGSTFKVDIRVDNTVGITQGINAYSYALLWDKTILSVTSVVDPAGFLNAGDGGSVTSIVTGRQTNTGKIIVNSIIINTSNASASSTGSGVLSTITFQALAAGSSNIGLAPSDVGIAYLSYPDSSGNSHDVVANSVNAMYAATNIPTPTPTPIVTPTPTPTVTPTPTPTSSGSVCGPIAKLSNQGTIFQVNTPIVLDGSSSKAGFDVQACPITNYAWLIQYQNGAIFGAYSGPIIAFSTSYIGDLNVTLIVTAADTNPNPNPTYLNTSYATVWITLSPASQQPTTIIDVFTQRGGVGHNVKSSPFAPQELVQGYANVTFGGAPVVNKNVIFTVLNPSGAVIAVRTSLTNSSGFGYFEYRTPWLDNGTTSFGIWSIIATVEISQVVVTDTVSFDYNYLVTINNNITVPASVHRGSPITVNVPIIDTDNTALSITTTLTIYDTNSVPVATYISNPMSITSSTTISATLTIPSWAFVGTATVYVNVLTNSPTSNGIPYCPERSATFQILA